MLKVSANEVQARFSELLERVGRSERVAIVRQGKTIAWLVPPDRKVKHLPSLAEFRAKIRVKGSLSKTVYEERGRTRK